MNLVGFTVEIYYDARPYERQTRGTSRCDVPGQQKMTPVSHSLANSEAVYIYIYIYTIIIIIIIMFLKG